MRCSSLLLLLICSLLHPGTRGQGIHPYVINTIAGHYPLGDGGPATDAILAYPESVLPGPDGRLYIGDRENYRIRVVAADGTISTLAENIGPRDLAIDGQGNLYVASNAIVFRITPSGESSIFAGIWRGGYSGDGGQATEAQFRYTRGLALASDGTLYVADDGNHVIRRISPDGIITTYAGNGTRGYSGDGGSATAAQLDQPAGVAVDAAGNLYIADYSNHRVRMVAPDGTITTFAGNGENGTPIEGAAATESSLYNPGGVSVDAAGNVYISDDSRSAVYRVTGGIVQKVAGTGTSGFGGDGGPAVDAQLDGPRAVRMGPDGSLYIADRQNHRIRKVAPDGSITTAAGRSRFGGDNGPASEALLFEPGDVAADRQGNIYISDSSNHRIRKVAPDGTISTYAGNGESGTSGNDGPATAASIGIPRRLAVDPQGNLYLAESYAVRRVRPDGIIEAVAGHGDNSTGVEGPAINAYFGNIGGMAAGPDGSVYLSDSRSHVVRRITPDGIIHPFAGSGEAGHYGDGGPAVEAQMVGPMGVGVDSQGNVFVADFTAHTVRRVDLAGVITTVAGNGEDGIPTDGQPAISQPLPDILGADMGPDGSVLLASWSAIFQITPSGLIYRIAGRPNVSSFGGDGGLATDASISLARGIAAGPTGDVYIADEASHRIRRLTPDTPARLEIAGDNAHTGLAGQPLSDPLAVLVIGTTGLPLPGVVVSYSVTSGDAVMDAVNATTDGAGVAATFATLGSAPGESTVAASAPGLAPVELTIRAVTDPNGIGVVPAVSAGGVVGAGLSVPPVLAVSPRGIVSLFGSAFAPPGTLRAVAPGDLVNGMLPTNLANVCVEMGDQLAYMLHVLDNQLNVQAPGLTPGTEVNVRVVRNCGTAKAVKSAIQTVTVQTTAPEFFYWIQNPDGNNPVAAVNPITGDYIGAPGLIPGLDFVRALPGNLIDIYATGFGSTNPSIAPGEIPSQLASTTARPVVEIGGVSVPDADILYSGVTQYAGVYLLRIKVPQLAAGDHTTQVRFGDIVSPARAYLTVGE